MIDSQLLVSGFVFGLSMGSIFFLMTIGLSLCFGVMRVISLDQLLYYTVGAYIAYTVSLAIGNLGTTREDVFMTWEKIRELAEGL